MPSTNFLQFDPQAVNMMNDETYNGDAQRVSGVSTGLARSLLYNKQAFQASTMVRAIANVMVNNGQNAMDNNLTSLTNNLQATFITSGANNTFTGTNTFSGTVALNGTISGSNSVKETITRWGMPDYSSGVSVGTSGYTATSNGIVAVTFNGERGGVTLGIYINGSQITAARADYNNQHFFAFPIAKNDTISYTKNKDGWYTSVMFYPCLGG